ncbi:MAG: metallophosphoesterase family protein [Pseudomonadota bacterium]
MVWLTESSTPDDLRIYAIGDVHGCLTQLQSVHRWIVEDISSQPTAEWKIIHVGDYVDRGEDSRGVLDYLVHCCAEDDRVICLKGNHDLMFRAGIGGDERLTEIWLRNGADATLASYDLSVDDFIKRHRDGRGFEGTVPNSHLSFIEGLDHKLRLGDYLFVHAGINPKRRLEDQEPDDMLWIRDRFIHSGREFDAVIVHGHTPSRKIDVRPNRVGIDTGAVFGGEMSCLVLEGHRKLRLTENGRVPLTCAR